MNVTETSRRAVWGTAARRGLLLVILCIPCVADAAGVAASQDFNVLASDQALAEAVLAQAEVFRREIAKEWLGQELSRGAGPAMITVVESQGEDSGLTWPIDDPKRKFHKVWLRTSEERALGSTLRHEITHVVLATQFPNHLPAWVEEGIASLSDDPERLEIRRRMLGRHLLSRDGPHLNAMFEAPTVPTSHRSTYSLAASVVEYLLTRADKATLLRFAVTGRDQGWDRAVQEHYGFRTVSDLETAWHAWVSQSTRGQTYAVLPSAQ